jgi:hypothetical protein
METRFDFDSRFLDAGDLGLDNPLTFDSMNEISNLIIEIYCND